MQAESWDTPLFTDPKADAVGSVLAFCTVVIASIGGVGGGGLLVPLYKLVLNLGVFAIPLSKATIFGSSLANVILRMSQRHPKADRPLIAYDVALVLEPMTLAGTVAGVMLNAIFPTWAITVLLVLLLCYTAQKTLLKGVSTWKKENKKSLEEMEKTVTVHGMTVGLLELNHSRQRLRWGITFSMVQLGWMVSVMSFAPMFIWTIGAPGWRPIATAFGTATGYMAFAPFGVCCMLLGIFPNDEKVTRVAVALLIIMGVGCSTVVLGGTTNQHISSRPILLVQSILLGVTMIILTALLLPAWNNSYRGEATSVACASHLRSCRRCAWPAFGS